MLTYDMDARGQLSKYEYLYRSIRADIERGAIAANDRLPSKRALAAHLGVSAITVEQAYAQLVAEGYLRARERSGFYANDLPDPPRLTRVPRAARRRQAAGEAEGAATVEAEGATTGASDTHVRPGGHPGIVADFTAAPPFDDGSFAAWMRAVRQVAASENPAETFTNVPAKGSTRLRTAIARHLEGSRGIVAEAADIVIGAGSQSLYGLLVQLIGRDAGYAVEDPGYPKLTNIYRAHGATVTHVPLDQRGICIAELERCAASVAHVMPSHQYPTGVVTDIARRYELLSWAARARGRYIVEDDYDCELRLAGRPVPALAGIDADERVVYLNTFARSISPTIRVAYMVLPSHLSEKFDRDLGFYANTVGILDQTALARLIESGSYERGVSRLRTAQRAQRDRLADAVSASAPADELWLEQADCGLHCVLAARTDRDERAIAAETDENGVRLTPLSQLCFDQKNYQAFACSLGPHPVARFLLNYAGIDEARMREAMGIVARCCGLSSAGSGTGSGSRPGAGSGAGSSASRRA